MDEIRRQANRRAAFITHLVATLLTVPLLSVLWHNNHGVIERVIEDTETRHSVEFLHQSSFDGRIIAVLLFAFIAHLMVYRYQARAEADQTLGEKWQGLAKALRRRRALFTFHLGSAVSLFLGIVVFREYSVVFNRVGESGGEWIWNMSPHYAGLSTMSLIFLLLILPHFFWLLYRELSDRTVKHALTQQEAEKQKNEVFATSEESASNWQIGDDGELWEVSEQQQKRLTQE